MEVFEVMELLSIQASKSDLENSGKCQKNYALEKFYSSYKGDPEREDRQIGWAGSPVYLPDFGRRSYSKQLQPEPDNLTESIAD